MKKIIACISLVFAMSAGVTALAAVEATPTTQDASNNTVSVTSDATYNTVLIEKIKEDETTEIVYLNQNDDGYTTAATEFLLKSDAGYGNYRIKTNNTAGTGFVEDTFTISEPVEDKDPIVLNSVELYKNDTYKQLGFTLTEILDGYDQLIITGRTAEGVERSLTADITNFTGPSEISIAVRVLNVPVDATVTVSVGCSTASN